MVVARGMSAEDPLVRMRAADVVEKVTIDHPEYLRPLRNDILGRIAGIDQQEVRWHVAQLLPRLELTVKQRDRAVDILRGYLLDKSNIVRTFSLEALTVFAERDSALRPLVLSLIKEQAAGGAPSIKSRSRKLLKRLKLSESQEAAIKELSKLKNIGPAIAEKLYLTGIRSPDEITEGDPEAIFARMNGELGPGIDRCVLYSLRGAKENRAWHLCTDEKRGGVK